MNRLKLEALASSILIYLIIIVTIFSIALYSPNKEKAITYTEKKSEVIEVSLGSPTPKAHHTNKKNKKTKKSEPKKPKQHKKPPKKVRNIKATKTTKATKKTKKPTKKVTKKSTKATKSAKSTKTTKATKTSASNLFKNIPKNIANDKAEDKPIGKAGKSLKKVNQGKGVVDKYRAHVQSVLSNWPAQSNFAGEKVRVELTIYSTGLFDYKIISRSLNPEFNRSLKAYLDQLKKFGFGPHSNPKPYKIPVEFIAKG